MHYESAENKRGQGKMKDVWIVIILKQ